MYANVFEYLCNIPIYFYEEYIKMLMDLHSMQNISIFLYNKLKQI